MSTELNPLFSKLNSTCHQAFELASEFCKVHNYYSIEIEHLLLILLEQSHNDVQIILPHYKISILQVRKELTRAIDKCRRGSEQTLYLSPSILSLLREAWLISSLQLNNHSIRSSAILQAIIEQDSLRNGLIKALPSLFKIPRESLQQELHALVKLSDEVEVVNDTSNSSTEAEVISAKSILSLYTIDLTEKARTEQLEPLDECQTEILKIIDILTCRQQNNPILIGEPGVGKTTLVESLAMKIAHDDVPSALKNVTVRLLDINAVHIQSDDLKVTLQSIVHEIKATIPSTILWLDNLHHLMNSDVDKNMAYLLKQTLLNGELRTIITITPSGYQKYIETEPVFIQRFQRVQIEEPSVEVAITRLRCRVPYLEQHHKVRITDKAIRQAVRLSHCYILGQKLPEKAVSVLDTACAKVATAQNSMPLVLKSTLERMGHLQEEWFMLQYEHLNGHNHRWRLEQLTKELEHLEHSKIELEQRWQIEQELVNQAHELEKSLEKIAHFPRFSNRKENKVPWQNKKTTTNLFHNPLLHGNNMENIAKNPSKLEKNEEHKETTDKMAHNTSVNPFHSFPKEGKPETKKLGHWESTWNSPPSLWAKEEQMTQSLSPFQREGNLEKVGEAITASYHPLQKSGHFFPDVEKTYSSLSKKNSTLPQENISSLKREKTTSLIGQPVLNHDDKSVSTPKNKRDKLPPAFIRKKRTPEYHESLIDNNASLLPLVKKEFSHLETTEQKLETETNVVFLYENEKNSANVQVLDTRKSDSVFTDIQAVEDQANIIDNEKSVNHSQRPVTHIENQIEDNSKFNQEIGHTEKIEKPSEKDFTKTSTSTNTDEQISALQSELYHVKQKLAKIQADEPMIPAQVDERVIATVIADWTNIPLNQILVDEIHTILNLKKKMAPYLIGQPRALDIIPQHIQTYRANLDNTHKLCAFLLTGPPGVGKTETALLLTDILYGGEQNLITLNMSDYQEAYAVSLLTGGSPGGMDYSKNGALIEAVQRNPYCVILLENIEKAHPTFIKFFSQILEKGALKTHDFAVNFKNTLILLTSQVGTDAIVRLCQIPSISPRLEQLLEAINPALLQHFQPDFLSRLITVPYYSLSDLEIRRVVKLKLVRLQQRCQEKYHAYLTYDEIVLNKLVKACTDVNMGAHNVAPILTDTLLPLLSTEILERMASEQGFNQVHLSCDSKGNLHYQFDTAKLLPVEEPAENHPKKDNKVKAISNQYEATELVEDLGEVLDGLKS